MSLFVPLPASLKASLLRCAALLVVGAAIGAATYRSHGEVTAAHREEKARRDELEARIQSASSDARLAEAGTARYRDLTERGIVGPERRADWLEYLSREREQGRALDVEYELQPRQAAAIESLPAPTARYGFMSSAMKLKLGLLHEQDFVGFLSEARRSVPALLHVRACRMERATGPDTNGIRLRAECEIDWITLRETP